METRLWIEEHDRLYSLLRHSDNVAPMFGIPDLLSACVALVFARPDPSARIFASGTERVCVYIRDDRATGDAAPPAVWFQYTADR